MKIPEYCAFGDDSAYKEILVYAYAIFHRDHLEKAEKKLNKIKNIFRIPQETHIHCRLLFSGKQREKLGLSHLNPGDVHQLVKRVVERMNLIPCWLRYGFCRMDEYRKFSELHPDADMTDKDELIFHDDPKAIMALASQACLLPNSKTPHAPKRENIEVFLSQDKTKINFIGNNRTRADRAGSYCNFFEKSSPPLRILESDHPLQQVADIYAYTCSHALSRQCDTNFFKIQLKKVKYWTSSESRTDYESTGMQSHYLSSKRYNEYLKSKAPEKSQYEEIGEEIGKKIVETTEE